MASSKISKTSIRKQANRDMVSWLPMPVLMHVPGPVGPTLDRNKTAALSNWQREALRRQKREIDRILLYNGLEDLTTDETGLPYGRGMHCINLFLYLWAKNENGHTCPFVKIPNMIIIRNGDIRFWFYLEESGVTTRGETHEIKKRPESECTRKHVLEVMNQEIFPTKGNPNGKNSMKAIHVAPPSAEYDFISSEYGIHIDYLDQEKLKKLVTEGVQDGGLPDGILQQYVRPFCEANIIYLCTWKPFFFYVSRITNESAGKTPEGVVKSGSKTTKMKTGDITDMVCKRLQQTCDAIASHVYEVSPQKYRIDSMRLGFKKDHLGNLWLLFCSDLIVSKLSDAAPCISKPRDFAFPRDPPAVPKPRKVTGNKEEFERSLRIMDRKAKARKAAARPKSAVPAFSSLRSNDTSKSSPSPPQADPPPVFTPRTEARNKKERQRPSTATTHQSKAKQVQSGWEPQEKHYQSTAVSMKTPKAGGSRPSSPPKSYRSNRHVSSRDSAAPPTPDIQTPRHERYRPSPTYTSVINGTSSPPKSRPSSALFTTPRYLGYDPYTGAKFSKDRLDDDVWGPVTPPTAEMADVQRARETLSPYLDHYRALPLSSSLSRELTRRLGEQMVEDQWNHNLNESDHQAPTGLRSSSPEFTSNPHSKRPTTASIVRHSLKKAQSIYMGEATRRSKSAKGSSKQKKRYT